MSIEIYTEENLRHIERIREIADTENDEYGPFNWVEDVYSLQGNVYSPVGRLSLPIIAEGMPVEDGFGPVRYFTTFSDEFFRDGEIFNPDYPEQKHRNLIDWERTQPEKLMTTSAQSELTGLRNHIHNYFAVREAVMIGKIGELFDGSDIMRNNVLSCFVEYK